MWRLLRDTVGGWYEDRAQRLGAALAFYTLFALAPGLVILIPLTGVFLGPQAAQGHIVGQIEALIGRRGAEAIEATIVSAREAGAGVTVIAVITLVFGMWWVFGELQDALNTIWGVTTRPGRGWLAMLRERFWSFTLVVGIGFLLLVSLAVSAWLAALSGFFAYLLPAPAVVLEAVNFVISFSVITVLFAMIFKVLPDVHVAWRDVWLGAALTSLLFAIGQRLIGLYLGQQAHWRRHSAPRGRSRSSSSGSTTPRKSCSSALSSPRSGHAGGARARCRPRRRCRSPKRPEPSKAWRVARSSPPRIPVRRRHEGLAILVHRALKRGPRLPRSRSGPPMMPSTAVACSIDCVSVPPTSASPCSIVRPVSYWRTQFLRGGVSNDRKCPELEFDDGTEPHFRGSRRWFSSTRMDWAGHW